MPSDANVIRNVLRAGLWTVRSRSFLDLSESLEGTVLLAGSGRSGTTWVQELIDRRHDYRIIFEPLNPKRVPAVAHFSSLQYLRTDDANPVYLEPIERILRGQLRNPWADHHNRARIARRRLVKEIRANLLMGNLATRFPEVRIVWLVRHPFAVAESALRMGWKDHLDDLLSQPELVADHLRLVEGQFAVLRDPFQRRIAQWSIEQLIPFRQVDRDQVHLVFYEDLVRDPKTEGGKLLEFLGEGWDREAEQAINRPSRLARPDGVSGSADPAIGWKSRVPQDARRAALEVLEVMGLGHLYDDDGIPNHDVVSTLWTGVEPPPASLPVLLPRT